MYKYKINYKGEEYLGQTLEGLAKSISRSKGIDLEEANKIITKLAQDFVPAQREQVFKERQKGGLKFRDAVHGASSILKTTLGLGAEQTEINERSVICLRGNNGTSCPKLSAVTDCRSCGFSGKFSLWWNGMKRKVFRKGYELDPLIKDKYCDVCSCALAAMIPAGKDDFKNESPEKTAERPAYCWIRNLHD